MIGNAFRRELTGGLRGKIALALMVPGLILALPGLAFMLPALRRIAKRMDYAETGGAPLLGVDGVAIIAHGRSNVKAIRNAVRAARDAVNADLVNVIRQGVANQRQDQEAQV